MCVYVLMCAHMHGLFSLRSLTLFVIRFSGDIPFISKVISYWCYVALVLFLCLFCNVAIVLMKEYYAEKNFDLSLLCRATFYIII